MWLASCLWVNSTSRTAVLFDVYHKALLRMISDVRGKDGMYAPDFAIGTQHLDTLSSSINERLKDDAHAVMEEAIASKGTGFFGEALKLRHRYVPDEHGRTRRDLTTLLLCDVPNRQIDRPGDLIAAEL